MQQGYAGTSQQDMARITAEQQQYYAAQREQMAQNEQRYANGEFLICPLYEFSR